MKIPRIQRSWFPEPPRIYLMLRDGFPVSELWGNLFSGITVGIVALPLAWAFAIASGVSPERGLYTAIVAGVVTSLLSRSRFQIGGPTGAFVVIVFGIVARHGYAGLQIATLMAAAMLLLMGFFRFGNLIRDIPYPVTTGFTTGIAVVIFSLQFKDLAGLSIAKSPADLAHLWLANVNALDSLNPYGLGVGFLTLGVVLLVRRKAPRLPAPMLGIALATLLVWAFGWPVETIGSRFGEIPSTLPAPFWPEIGWAQVRELVPEAFTIAVLAAIESLLCAVVADGMTGDRHDPNTELLATGFANLASGIFGGIPATGALARTATNIRAGATSPVSGLVHAITLLGVMLAAAPLASLIPLPALAAVLTVVAWNMSEVHRFRGMFRAPRSDTLVMLVTFGLTVLVDMVVGVEVGIVLAAFLFMRRMSEVSWVGPFTEREVSASSPIEDPDPMALRRVPERVEVYEINGPFFFGLAGRLRDVLHFIESDPDVVVLRMRHVPAMDATGIHALEDFLEQCRGSGITLVLSGVRAQPAKVLLKSGLAERIGEANIRPNFDSALARAQELILKKG